MSRSNVISRTATPAVVAQQLADVLQCFPSASMEGVQWSVLARKYEERHSTKLNLEALGHSSALAAATALLWDVVRIVDAEDTDNPVVAVEDAIALTPTPGSLASWPSLYHSLCEIVCNHGCADADGQAILLSQVKPLLQRHWHSNFDESGLSYFTEEGSTLKLKKMKHLLQAVLRWRAQRADWRSTSRCAQGAIDAAVDMQLELVPSKSHNDLLLRVTCQGASADTSRTASAMAKPLLEVPIQMEEMSTSASASPRSQKSAASANSALQDELARLRSENAKLRFQKDELESRSRSEADAVLRAQLFDTPSKPSLASLEEAVLDNPFEPPPEMYCHPSMWGASPAASTGVPSCWGFDSDSGNMTPASRMTSGSVTPVPQNFGPSCNGVAMVPVWFPIMGEQYARIPNGIVQHARAVFECQSAIPSFFVQAMQ